jgi:thiol:disulfide interchange protein DsbD
MIQRSTGLAWVVSWIAILSFVSPLIAQIQDGKELVKAHLVVDRNTVRPGEKFRLGVLYEMEPGWHIYWKYAGDAGIPPQIDWQLPPGFKPGPLNWPLPVRDKEAGDLEVFTYPDQTLLWTEVEAPKDLATGPQTLKATNKWLVCKESCVPGQADLTLTLNSPQTPADPSLFDQYASHVPTALPQRYQVKAQRTGKEIVIQTAGFPAGAALDFFPVPQTGITLGHAKQDGARIIIPVDDGSSPFTSLAGVLVVGSGGQGYESNLDLSPMATGAVTGSSSFDWLTFLQAVCFAFLGGLILNVMPCVLPVISLKIFGFVQEAGSHKEISVRLALAFSAGILACFFLLAFGVILLRALGNQVGWGFQFQDERFLLVLAALVFAFALNLFGVFELSVSARATGGLAELAQGTGYRAAFFQGVFATVLATPCTAPFLGTASAFAFAQPSWVTATIFGFVGLGMASPYLLLAAQPGWLRLIPRPGAWMVYFKQFLGFLLLGTLLWLAWIIGQLKGVSGMVYLGGLLLLIALLAWIKGSFWRPDSSWRSRWLALAGMLVAIGSAWWINQFITAPSQLAWEKFSPQTLDAALATGRPVFVDFTADWCLTCKANERFAIDTPAVRAAFARNNVVTLRADWTNGDPAITEILKQNGRAGVPLYLLYPGGGDQKPIVFPELITSNMVLEHLSAGKQVTLK